MRADRPTRIVALAALAAALLSAGCRQDMASQPRYDPLEESTFFPDRRAARPVVPGTIARGQLNEDAHLHSGRVGGELATTFPFPVTRAVLERGQQRYNIFCAPCHDRVGTGEGMIVRRGYRRASSFHTQKLREAPVGHFFDAVTNGFGAMPSYAAQIPPRDRWAIIAYIRALQASQNATLADVPAAEREKLDAQK